MAGLSQPLAGAVTWDNEAIFEDPEAHNHRLHYIGHADPVKPVLTVTENLRFWTSLRLAGGVGDAIHAALSRLGISHLADVPGRFLSAGQKRRVNLARIVAAPAPLWLLDEPHTALDQAAMDSLDDAIAGHRDSGGMVVMSAHAHASPDDADTLDLGQFQENLFEETGA